ncbi:MAG: Ig-like domain-containing protein [Colwellia sp.]|nr:Ig-like domain-containing protein [Colwellia sp.]
MAIKNLNHLTSRLLVAAALLLCASALSAEYPNQSYDASLLARPTTPQRMGTENKQGHHNQAHAHGGFVVISGNAKQYVWDISDPRNPYQRETLLSPYRSGEAEGHQLSFAKYPNGREYMATVSGHGIDIWNVTDIGFDSKLIKSIELPGVNYGDNTNAVWGIGWQGKHIYVGATNLGMFIIDVSDPEKPRDAVTPSSPSEYESIKTSQWEGVHVGPIWPIGNLLVFGTPKESAGIVTMDISQPRQPLTLDVVQSDEDSYITWFYGKYAYWEGRFRPFDVTTDPENITALPSTSMPSSEYMNFADDMLFLGGLRPNPGIHKYDISQPASPIKIGERIRWHETLLGADDQFALPIGNLVLVSDDQANYGSFLAVHDTQPDVVAPTVKYINPIDRAINQSITSRIGISLSDQIDLRSVNANSVSISTVDGEALEGVWSLTHYLLNFEPSQVFSQHTTYQVRLEKGGIKDLAGNGLDRDYEFLFSTGDAVDPGEPCRMGPLSPASVGDSITFSGSSNMGGAIYSWEFGDGQAATGAVPTHHYNSPGRYNVKLTVREGMSRSECAGVQIVHYPLSAQKPTASSSIIFDAAEQTIITVNPDANTLTIIDANTGDKIAEVATGIHPRTLAKAGDGHIWVVNQDSSEISIHNPRTGVQIERIELTYGDHPFGIAFNPRGDKALVSTEGRGRVYAIDVATHERLTWVINDTEGGSPPALRGVAVSADGRKAYITRFISDQEQAEVYVIDIDRPRTIRRTRSGRTNVVDIDQLGTIDTVILAHDPGNGGTEPDDQFNSRGVPNYLSSIRLSPDGRRAWVSSKKDNTQRGLARDGRKPIFDMTVRSIVSPINLQDQQEVLAERIDINNTDSPSAIVFSEPGDLMFIALQGSNKVDVMNAYTGDTVASIATELAPQGLVLDNNGQLFVQNFMSRSVSMFNVSAILAGSDVTAELIDHISTVANEPLSPSVLLGKQIFYNAADIRMSKDGYISCATCHIDGGQDGRVWDVSDRGEGVRNTIDLRGRLGMGHGLLHWSANFDEIQDFENDIRTNFGGLGFMTDDAFNSGTRSAPLGLPKAGVSPELDALSDYVSSLTRAPQSPYRNSDSTVTNDAIAGKAIFRSLGCADCHVGTDGVDGKRHDVGTLTTDSGQRLGGPLTGIDTPTLNGVWASAPYFHDGSARTLLEVIDRVGHGNGSSLTDEVSWQFEDETLTDGVKTSANSSGFAGTGFVDYPNTGGRVNFSAENLTAGTYDLQIRFANGANQSRQLQIFVDDQLLDTLSFTGNGDWRSWRTLTASVQLPKQANLSLRGIASGPGPNIDQAILSGSATEIITTLEAESAILSAGVAVDDRHSGFTGTGFADFPMTAGMVEFDTSSFGQGSYKLAIVFANGSDAARPLGLYVGNTLLQTLSFDTSSGWNRWQTLSLSAELPGNANLSLRGLDDKPGPNIDSITLTGSSDKEKLISYLLQLE